MNQFIPKEIFTNSPLPVCILEGPDHVYTFSNSAYDHLINSCDLMSRSVKEVSPELIGQKFISTLNEVYATGEAYHNKEVQLLIKAEDAYKHLFIDISCYPLLDGNKEVYGIFTQIHDTTEAVELRNILLMELHHRVKNNLAFIISLIQLQSNELKDQQHQLILTAAQKRIRTIAKVHDLILNQQDLKKIPVQKLLWSLFDHGLNYFDTGQSMVTVDVDEFFINVNQAIPLGLICNEVIGLIKNRLDNDCSVSINSDLSDLPSVELFIT
ncbi:MAG: histidine kinase dimerization/phosphoacceptor domain -containing protein, partial [Balneolales bacterium]